MTLEAARNTAGAIANVAKSIPQINWGNVVRGQWEGIKKLGNWVNEAVKMVSPAGVGKRMAEADTIGEKFTKALEWSPEFVKANEEASAALGYPADWGPGVIIALYAGKASLDSIRNAIQYHRLLKSLPEQAEKTTENFVNGLRTDLQAGKITIEEATDRANAAGRGVIRPFLNSLDEAQKAAAKTRLLDMRMTAEKPITPEAAQSVVQNIKLLTSGEIAPVPPAPAPQAIPSSGQPIPASIAPVISTAIPPSAPAKAPEAPGTRVLAPSGEMAAPPAPAPVAPPSALPAPQATEAAKPGAEPIVAGQPGTPQAAQPVEGAASAKPLAAKPAPKAPAEGAVSGKKQKAYLLGELDKTLAEAPQGTVEQGQEPSRYGETDNRKLEREAANKAVYERNKAKFGTVTFHVPGDGDFEILNNRESLTRFREIVKKKFPVGTPKQRMESKIPGPTAPPKVAVRPTGKTEIEQNVSFAVSADPQRTNLGKVYTTDSGEMFATDGRRAAIVLTQKFPKTPGTHPPIVNVIPGYQKGKMPVLDNEWAKIEVNTSDILPKLYQARAVMSERSNVISFRLGKDGQVEIYQNNPTVGAYDSGDVEKAKSFGTWNTDFAIEAFEFMRKMGNEKITLAEKPGTMPFLILGKKEYVVQMPFAKEVSSDISLKEAQEGKGEAPAAQPPAIVPAQPAAPEAKPPEAAPASPAEQVAAPPVVPATQPATREPWQMTRKELKQHKIDYSGKPYTGVIPPEGTWRMSKDGELSQLRRVNIADITFGESTTEPGIFKSVAEYTKMWKEGKRPQPPDIVVNVSDPEHPVLRTVNRRRVLAAKEAGETSILAWVSDSDPKTGRAIPDHKELIRQALASGKPVPPEVLADYPDLAKQVPPAKAETAAPTKPEAPLPIEQRPEFKTFMESLSAKEGEALAAFEGEKEKYMGVENRDAFMAEVIRRKGAGEEVTPEMLKQAWAGREFRKEKGKVQMGEEAEKMAAPEKPETAMPENQRRQKIIEQAMPKMKGSPLVRITAAAFHKTLSGDLTGKSLMKEVRNAVTEIAKGGYKQLGIRGGYSKTILADDFRKAYDKVIKVLRANAVENPIVSATSMPSKVLEMSAKNIKDVNEYNAKREQSGSLTLPSPIVFEKRSWSDVQNTAMRRMLDVSRTPMDLVGAIKSYALDAFAKYRKALVFYPELRKYPVFRNDLRLLMDAPTDAINLADVSLYGIVGKLKHDRKGYNTFRHIVALEDLIGDAEQEKDIPGGFTLDDLKKELEYQYSIASPEVKEAAEKHFEIMRAVADDMVERGKMKPESVKGKYAHHAVMDYQTPWGDFLGLPRRIKVPFRQYLKSREGSVRLIDMDYIGVTRSYLSKVFLDNAMDDWIVKQGKAISLESTMSSDQWKEFKKDHPPAPNEIVDYNGKRYRWFQFQPGNTMREGKIISESLLSQAVEESLLAEQLLTLEGPKGGKAISDGIILGGKHKMFLVPEEIYDTLKSLRQPAGDMYNIARELVRATSMWKRITIDLGGLPIRVNNMFGDFMKPYFHDPKAYLNFPVAAKIIAKRHPAIKRWFHTELNEFEKKIQQIAHAGGVDKASIYREMSYVLNDDALFQMRHPYMRFNPLHYIMSAWEGFVMDTEMIPRYAKLITDMNRIYAGESVHSSTLDGVKELDEAGFKVEAASRAARLMTVDYREVSPTYSRWARGVMFPFVTWFDYTSRDMVTYMQKTKGMGIAKVLIPYALMWLWNNTGRRRDDEEKLPSHIRYMFHINTGYHDKDGKAIVFSMMTPVDAFAKWFGLDRIGEKITKVRAGQMTTNEAVVEQLKDVLKGPARNLRSLLHPLVQVIYGITANKHPVFGTPIAPENAGPSKKTEMMVKFATSAFFTPYAQLLRIQRDYEPGEPWKKFLFEGGPLDIEKSLGVKRLDLGHEQMRAVDTATREKLEPLFNEARDRVEAGFIRWQTEGEKGKLDSALAYCRDLAKKKIYVQPNDIRKWITSRRVALMIQKEKLRKAPQNSDEARELRDSIRQLEQMAQLDRLGNLPKGLLPAVQHVINSIYNTEPGKIESPEIE